MAQIFFMHIPTSHESARLLTGSGREWILSQVVGVEVDVEELAGITP